MQIEIHSVTLADQSILREMLYQAIFVPPGEEPPSRDILNDPEIAHYAEDWGKEGDVGYKAVKDEVVVGAAWLRLINGYGFIAEDIPELTIAVLPEYRGQGIGTDLLATLVDTAARRYRGISLSVVGENPAINLYRRFGFEIVRPDGASYTMLLRFKND